MTKSELVERINEFISTEKTGEGKGLSEGFIDSLAGFFCLDIFEEVKRGMEAVRIGSALPDADAGLVKGFKHGLGKDVHYVLFKQVRRQAEQSLKVKLGWQYDALSGRTEEIQVRSDYGILYRVSGNWVLQDFIFKTRKEAVDKCNELNAGTDAFYLQE